MKGAYNSNYNKNILFADSKNKTAEKMVKGVKVVLGGSSHALTGTGKKVFGQRCSLPVSSQTA
jgi:hypothetical protein